MKRHAEKWRENLKNRVLKFSRDGNSDRQTDLPRDRPSYRDARTHLKRSQVYNFVSVSDSCLYWYTLPLLLCGFLDQIPTSAYLFFCPKTIAIETKQGWIHGYQSRVAVGRGHIWVSPQPDHLGRSSEVKEIKSQKKVVWPTNQPTDGQSGL